MRIGLSLLLATLLFAAGCSSSGSEPNAEPFAAAAIDDAADASAAAPSAGEPAPAANGDTDDDTDTGEPATGSNGDADDNAQTESGATPTSPPATVAPTSTPPQGPPISGEPARDRIVVATAGGGIFVVDPDGQNRLDLVGDDGAFARTSLFGVLTGGGSVGVERDDTGFGITTANPDGSERRHAPTLFAGYYGFWDPTSTLLGFLGNDPPGTGLVLDDGTGASLDATIDSDTFYYFSWKPDGSEWVVHSGAGFRIVGTDGSRRTIDLDDAQFRAPVWAPDGTIILALNAAGQSVIVRYDPDTGATEELATVGSISNFVLDPTGRRLAIESLDIEPAPDIGTDAQTVGFVQQTPTAELIVLDLQTGATSVVLDTLTGGFWWSPDGEKLAILVAEVVGQTFWNRWQVWSDEGSFETERFLVTSAYAGMYIPFFDQFAQSVTPWAPDSGRFVYTGTDEAGIGGVFVQPATATTPAVRIAEDGTIAFWSPT